MFDIRTIQNVEIASKVRNKVIIIAFSATVATGYTAMYQDTR